MALAFTLLFVAGAHADSILLRGGEKLIGKVVSENAAKIVIESQTLGKIEISSERIERIERDAPPVSAAPASTNPPAATGLTLTNQFLPWTSGLARSSEFDWIQLKSGEWLAGKIKSLQEEKLEFDSEELDVFTFDWKDIRALRSSRLNSVRLEDGKTVDGHVFVTMNEVRVATATDTNVYPRADLLALTPTGNRELDKWTGKIKAGASFRAGNTREADVNAQVTLQRRTPDTRLFLDYQVNYGEANDAQIEQNHRFTGQYDYFLSRRLYVRVPDVEYYRDPVLNLSHRLTVGAGVGYDIVKTPLTEWNVTVSPSWQRNWYGSVPATNNPVEDSAALVLSTRFDTELTRRVDLIFEYRGQLSRKETGEDTHHAETTFEFEIHKRLKLDLTFEWDRTARPQAESGGGMASPDDFRLTTSLGVDF